MSDAGSRSGICSVAGLSVSGNTLNVYGTSGNDSFSFSHGTSINTVTLNGATYVVNPALIHNINFYGGGGSDTATLTDQIGHYIKSQRHPSRRLAYSVKLVDDQQARSLLCHRGKR